MCWYSAEYAEKVSQAEAGQRLGLRRVHGIIWAVRERDLDGWRRDPEPVCLVDGTKVLFRFSERQQAQLDLPAEIEATFRMLHRPKRDAFEFANGWTAEVNALPPGLIFDVMVIPGREHLSRVLSQTQEGRHEDEEVDRIPRRKQRPQSFLRRLLQLV